MTPAVQVDGASQRFGARVIFRDVSYTVAPGEVFAILGGSGSGKSTLLRQAIGLLRPTEGSIRVFGHDVVREPGAVRRQIGVLFQSGALLGSMTLLENVMLPLQMLTALPAEACAAIARVKLAQVGLAEAEALRPSQLSGGMIKRGGLARAMALDPPLLFLDEPSAGLDPVTSAGLDKLILQLRDTLGATFVVVTHELPSIMAIADRCLMLGEGGVLASGDPKRLAADCPDPAVQAFFGRRAA